MRGLTVFIVFFSLLPIVLVKGPFVGVLIWYWISLMNPHQDVWGSTFGRIPYALITALATLSFLLLDRREPKLPPKSKITTLLILLMIWISITSLFGTAQPDVIYYYWALAEKMLLMTLVSYSLTTTRERLDQLIAVWVGSIAIYGVKGGIFSLLTAGSFRVFGPDGSMIGDNNDLGVALTMVLPMMFYLRALCRRPLIRHAMLALICLTFLGDIFTYSRGALVALIFMSFTLCVRSNKKGRILLLIALAGIAVWNLAPEAWIQRMFTIGDYQEDTSAEGRILMWKRAWAVAQERPITGAGIQWSLDPDSANIILMNSGLPPLTRPTAVHSSWFEMLSGQGIVGLGIFVSIVIVTFVNARWLVVHARGKPELFWADNLGRLMQASLIGFSAGCSFSTHAMYDGFYAMVIIAAAARRIIARELVSKKATPALAFQTPNGTANRKPFRA